MRKRFETRLSPRIILTRDAAESGITERERRNGSQVRPILRGAWTDLRSTEPQTVPSWADNAWETMHNCLRALLLTHRGVAASHGSAAQLYGLPLPWRFDLSKLHVSADQPNLRIRRPEVVLHRLCDFDRTEWFGLPLVPCPHLFVQLAGELSVDDLVILGDAMIGSWHSGPLCHLDDLTAFVESRKYLRNRQAIASALALIRADVDSPQETRLRLWMISVGFPEPTIHPSIYCRALGYSIRPDLGYPHAKIALEYEGAQHLDDRDQWETDISRVNALIEEGWTVLRVSSKTNCRVLEQTLRTTLARAETP